MTKKELFTKVRDHLLSQKRKSHLFGSCRYHYLELRCAIGCLISDDVYSYTMEGMNIREIINMTSQLSWMGEHILLLDDLRVIHDAYPPEQWSGLLDAVAVKHNIT